jgi:hypothetical protein
MPMSGRHASMIGERASLKTVRPSESNIEGRHRAIERLQRISLKIRPKIALKITEEANDRIRPALRPTRKRRAHSAAERKASLGHNPPPRFVAGGGGTCPDPLGRAREPRQ